MKNIYGLNIEDIGNWLIENNKPIFHAKQIFDWLYVKRVKSFEEMTNLSKDLREQLSLNFSVVMVDLVLKQTSVDGTIKFLFGLEDKELIETVLMKYKHGYSLCITTQVGCRIGCSFCASGIKGLDRNLHPHEIVQQVLYADNFVKEKYGSRISSIVVMGIGEPLDNYDNLLKGYKIINSNYGINIGSRHITVSTAGVANKIYDFATDFRQVELAISLHAANDKTRTDIMKINKAFNLKKLSDSLKYYQNETGKRISFEYILLSKVNDSIEDAIDLANFLRQFKNYHVNLIPYNEVEEAPYKRPGRNEIMDFYNYLKDKNLSVTIRRENGSDIDSACGQLRHKEISK